MAVVLDIRLPGMDGWDVLAALKARPRDGGHPRGRRVGARRAGRRASSLGAAEYLVKPVSRDELLAALARVGVTPPPLGAVGAGAGIGAPMSDCYRILVVEDNELNLKLVRDVLGFAGYEVIEARTGEQGVALAAECRPDLVLMDLQLPGIDGTEAMRQLRASPLTQEVPVVAVTAFAMREDRERAFRSGFDGYVEKPFSARELPAQVRSFLQDGPA